MVTLAVARAGEFRFPVGLAYVHGISEAADELEDLYTSAGFTISDDFDVPISLVFSPYYEFDNGFGVGVDVGPFAVFLIETDTATGTDDDISYVVPIGAHVRYTFMRGEDFSPYLRAGVRYPIAGGDNIDSSTLGVFGSIGMELWQWRRVGMAFEAGIDTSKIELEGPTGIKEDVLFPGFTASVMVTF